MANKSGHRGWGHIRKLPSGRYQASYVEKGNRMVRHTAALTYTAKEDAEHWLASERREMERGTWTPPPLRRAEKAVKSVTVAQFATTWIAERKLGPRTRDGYESKLRLHITPTVLGRTPVGDLTPELVRSWYSGLGDNHPTRNAHCYALLHAVLQTAVTDGVLAANPAHIVGAMSSPTKRQPVILSVTELAALAEAMPERFRALILLKAWCGLRWGEVIELRRKDIDNDAEVVYVRRGVTHRKKECHIGTVKQKKAHTVVIPPHIRADLKHHLDVFTAKGDEALLFPPARGGCHLNDRVFRDYLDPALVKIGQKSGKDGMVVHDLKHFAGTMTARVGNLRETMARLGHSTVKASLIYQQQVTGRDAEVAAALSELAAAGQDGEPAASE
ncbi:integrase [Mycobacterium sp. ENV421]|uniref:tyrosine-type recombinase/integrase n=1 Tax=Mycobacterium sp. ENV421 TaxID=1213407 RepID=UPI000C9B58B1|nr:site-specific integrase [Mycobacterium sp. ENV421]PND54351.1 integrase [Mycobacterium sp. ENV421]